MGSQPNRFDLWADKVRKGLPDPALKDTKKRAKTYRGLVDVIFAVIIGESFVHVTAGGITTLSVNAAVLAMSYVTVVYSWVGYHRSIAEALERSWPRFAVDLTTLFVYWILVTFYAHFQEILWAYFALFVLYLIWGFFKGVEYVGEWARYIKRLWYPPAFLVLALTYPYFTARFPVAPPYSGAWEIAYLVVVAILLTLYWVLEPTRLHHGQSAVPPPGGSVPNPPVVPPSGGSVHGP
jgi:hypothetical protein